MNEKDVSEISKANLELVLKEEVEGLESRLIEVKIDDQTFSKTLKELGFVASEDVNEFN